MTKLKIIQGRMLFQRFGPLRPQKQAKGITPERYGIWAFPDPFFDWFFAWHRWNTYMPKDIRQKNGFVKVVSSVPKFGDDDWHTFDWDEHRIKQDEWMEKNKHKFPIKKFWSAGPVWAKMDHQGDPISDWQSFTVQALANVISHSERGNNPYGQDHYQVFLGRGTF